MAVVTISRQFGAAGSECFSKRSTGVAAGPGTNAQSYAAGRHRLCVKAAQSGNGQMDHAK